jgi:biopolymer transport protein ExbD
MSGMTFRERRARKQVQLNVTSLIDVLFLLLIFFMITGTFKRVGELELTLPESTTSTPAGEGSEAHQAELILAEDGTLRLEGTEVSRPELLARLQALLAADPGSGILIKAETHVEHGEVVRLLDIVREAGFPGVGLGTDITPVTDEIAPPR